MDLGHGAKLESAVENISTVFSLRALPRTFTGEVDARSAST
jgi:hypothetical protein